MLSVVVEQTELKQNPQTQTTQPSCRATAAERKRQCGNHHMILFAVNGKVYSTPQKNFVNSKCNTVASRFIILNLEAVRCDGWNEKERENRSFRECASCENTFPSHSHPSLANKLLHFAFELDKACVKSFSCFCFTFGKCYLRNPSQA